MDVWHSFTTITETPVACRISLIFPIIVQQSAWNFGTNDWPVVCLFWASQMNVFRNESGRGVRCSDGSKTLVVIKGRVGTFFRKCQGQGTGAGFYNSNTATKLGYY